MSGLLTLFVLIAIIGLMLAVHYIDARWNYNFFAWFSGENVNPFKPQNTSPRKSQGNESIDALKSRIETLETIVTEPAYELNKKINQL